MAWVLNKINRVGCGTKDIPSAPSITEKDVPEFIQDASDSNEELVMNSGKRLCGGNDRGVYDASSSYAETSNCLICDRKLPRHCFAYSINTTNDQGLDNELTCCACKIDEGIQDLYGNGKERLDGACWEPYTFASIP